MKAILLSRPGDFGLLENFWPDDPLLLPLLNGTVLGAHAHYWSQLGIRQVRVLRAVPAGQWPQLSALESALAQQSQAMDWSVRAWPVGPWPHGLSLSAILRQQEFFWKGEDCLVVSAAQLFLEPWLGSRAVSGFPINPAPAYEPLVLTAGGILESRPMGVRASLTGPHDYYFTVQRLLEMATPAQLSLKSIHTHATIEPPVSLGSRVRAAADSIIGPLSLLVPQTRVAQGARVSKTLVLTPVSIGKNTQIHEKIIIGNKVIDPIRGNWAEIDDRHYLSEQGHRTHPVVSS